MRHVPLVFGFPAWHGKIKARVAKKYLHRWSINFFIRNEHAFGHLKVGDYINDCSGYNGQIVQVFPIYRRIGTGRGSVLVDVDLDTSNTSCSIIHCGIEPEVPRQEVINRTISSINEWTLGEPGKKWFGDKWEEEAEKARQLLADLQAGGHHTVGPRGERIK